MTIGRLLTLAAWTFACPGAVHGVMGRRRMTIAWAAAGVATAIACTWVVWALHVALAVRLASAVDGVLRARRRGANAPEHPNLPLLASAVGVLGFLYFQFVIERFRIPASSMMPTIAIDDHLLVDKLTPYARPPRRGEVIVFAHPCQPDRSYVKRVIAIGGDTVEVRCHQLYVNGAAVPTMRVPHACAYADEVGGEAFTRACSRYRETLDGHTYDTLHDADRPARDATPGGARDDAKDFPSLDGVVRSCPNEPASAANRAGTIAQSKPGATACEPQLHFVVPTDTLFTMGDNRASSSDSRSWGVVPLDHVTGRAIGVVLPLAHTRSLR